MGQIDCEACQMRASQNVECDHDWQPVALGVNFVGWECQKCFEVENRPREL